MNGFVVFNSPLKTIISLYLLKTKLKRGLQLEFKRYNFEKNGIEAADLDFFGYPIFLFRPLKQKIQCWLAGAALGVTYLGSLFAVEGEKTYYTFLVDCNGNLLWDPIRYYIHLPMHDVFEIKDKVTGDKGILGKDGRSVICWGIEHISCFLSPQFMLPSKGHGFYAKAELQMSDGSKKYLTQDNRIKICGI